MNKKYLTVWEEYEFLELIAVFDGYIKGKFIDPQYSPAAEIALFVKAGVDPYAHGFVHLPCGLLPYNRHEESLVLVTCKFLYRPLPIPEEKKFMFEQIRENISGALIKLFNSTTIDRVEYLFIELALAIKWYNEAIKTQDVLTKKEEL